MTTIGEIELKAVPTEVIVQWKIKEFSSLTEEVYCSCLFSFANETWCLSMYPNGDSAAGAAGFISVYLKKISSSAPIEIVFAFDLKTVDGKKPFHTRVFQTEMGQGHGQFISRSKLLEFKSTLMPSDILPIICILKCPKLTEYTNASGAKSNMEKTSSVNELDSDEKHKTSSEDELDSDEKDNEKVSSKMKGLEILSENLKQVLLDGLMTDVVLKTDGQEFNVHKIFLVARSPVFASMFQHDLTEKNTNEVDIPDCTAESFEVFLHYLYSGSVETLSTSNVYNVYYAADKYQVDDLKEKCVKFMMKNISAESFCDVIALSLRHGESELQKIATDFFSKNVKKIIKTVEWQKYLDENSTQANELLIKALNA